MARNLFLFKGDFSFGKSQSHWVPNLGCRGADSPGWLDVLPKKIYTRHDAWAGTLSWWSCQSPVAHSFGLLNHPNSFCRGMFKLNAKFDANSLLYLPVILNAAATQYTCSFNGVYYPHWLVQWSCHCSCMHIPVHSPWLPGYINVAQTILVISTMAGLLPDRPCIRFGTIHGFRHLLGVLEHSTPR